jgi:hypothetical protein
MPLLDLRRVIIRSVCDNALDHARRNPIEISNLIKRHPVTRQRTNPTMLRSRYLRPSPAHLSSRFWFLVGRYSNDRLRHGHHRRDGDDARFAGYFLRDLQGCSWGRCRRFRAVNALFWFEQSLGGFAGFIDLLAIVMSVRRMPVMRQGVSPDVFLVKR